MDLGTIYMICAIAGGTILVLRVILMAIGLDQGDAAGAGDVPDVNVDAGLDVGGDLQGAQGGAFNLLSLQSIAGFFTMFGLVGMGLLQVGASDTMSLIGALAAGAVTAVATAAIFRGMRRLQSEGTLVIQNAVGQVGTVYLTIPAEGTGVVTVTVQGASRTLDAASENGQRIPTGRMVKVVGIAAGKILVVSELAADHS